MTNSAWIEGPAIEALLPHRGVNLLIDGVQLAEEREGRSRLRVSSGDPQGRDIFLREGETGSGGGYVMMGPALAEHLALSASCVLSRELKPGEIALFSRISKFELARGAAAGEELVSEVKRLKDKGNFRRFDGTVRGEGGGTVATAEIMAYTADPRQTAESETAKLVAPPQIGEARPVDRGLFAWKRPEMVFVDELVDLANDGQQATFRYTYPADHPFCPGHFPGGAVMMGIAQWMAACDAAAWLVHERAESGGAAPTETRFRADAEIVRESGTLVAEVRGLVFSFASGAGGIAPLRVEATRRVGFRDLVRAGETIFVRVRAAADG